MTFTGRAASENTAATRFTGSEAVETSTPNSKVKGVMRAPRLLRNPPTTRKLVPRSTRCSQARFPSLMKLGGFLSGTPAGEEK